MHIDCVDKYDIRMDEWHSPIWMSFKCSSYHSSMDELIHLS